MQEGFPLGKDDGNTSEHTPKEIIELFPPNKTVYIRNLNEKIPLDGFCFIDFLLKLKLSQFLKRFEAGTL